MSFQIIAMHERVAEQAWEVHRALLKAEKAEPALAANPMWQIIRADAYETFHNAFEVLDL